DIDRVGNTSDERVDYPTQKPEELLKRIITVSSNENDIIIDGFLGRGTTIAVGEKLKRRWIGIDCGKLSIYTGQKRILNLTNKIGSNKPNKKIEIERWNDAQEHSKSNSRGLLLVYEKARAGDLNISDTF